MKALIGSWYDVMMLSVSVEISGGCGLFFGVSLIKKFLLGSVSLGSFSSGSFSFEFPLGVFHLGSFFFRVSSSSSQFSSFQFSSQKKMNPTTRRHPHLSTKQLQPDRRQIQLEDEKLYGPPSPR